MKTQNNPFDPLEDFAVGIIRIILKLDRTFTSRHIAGQLIRSSTSAGANYEEACGAESRSDFVHKLQIVLKELRESLYWLRLILKSGLVPSEKVSLIMQEANELTNIIAKSIVTAKKNK